MLTVYSKQHQEIVGSVNGASYKIVFDADGFAEVSDEVAEQLATNEKFGIVLIDEDGAEIAPAKVAKYVRNSRSKKDNKNDPPKKAAQTDENTSLDDASKQNDAALTKTTKAATTENSASNDEGNDAQ